MFKGGLYLRQIELQTSSFGNYQTQAHESRTGRSEFRDISREAVGG